MRVTALLTILTAVLAGGCGDDAPVEEPDHITIDHILIGVKGPRTLIPRTEDQGRQIAERLVERLNKGEDWAELKAQYSEDPPIKGQPRGGPYELANTGVQRSHSREARRKDMVPEFGNVGFKLKVGEIGLARFNLKTSPLGFHIIKRIR